MRTEWIWISADDGEAILWPVMGPTDGLERMKWMHEMIGGYYTHYPIVKDDLFWMGSFPSSQFSLDDFTRFFENIENLWCDEEGDLKGSPLNKRATSLVGKTIVGNVLIELKNPNWDGTKEEEE